MRRGSGHNRGKEAITSGQSEHACGWPLTCTIDHRGGTTRFVPEKSRAAKTVRMEVCLAGVESIYIRMAHYCGWLQHWALFRSPAW